MGCANCERKTSNSFRVPRLPFLSVEPQKGYHSLRCLFDVIISSRFSYLIEYQLSSGYYVVNEGRLEDFFLSGSFEDRYTQHLGNTNRAKEIEEKTLIDLSNRIDEKFQEALTDFYTTTAQSNNIRTAIAVLAFIISLIALIR